MSDDSTLFTEGDLRATLETIGKKMRSEISNLALSQVRPPDDEKVRAHFLSNYQIEPISLNEEALELIEPREVEVSETRNDYGHRGSFTRKLLEFRFELPFTGHGELLFRCAPSSPDFNPPRGVVVRDQLVLTLRAAQQDGGRVKSTLEAWKSSLRKYISWQQPQIAAWNASLEATINQCISARREKLEADNQFVADLGVPVRKRGDAPKAYSAPVSPKKVTPSLPSPTKGAIRKPEPVLELAIYEEILDTLASMSVTMERCPSAFAGMKEEDLRMQFLIPLNSRFQGQTSGETFNASGKTDILIKQDDRIVFVAECKFWKGPKSLSDTIDQLLSYLTWRETKAAILLFNRQKDLSSILSQVPDVFQRHPQFVRSEPYSSETGFRFIVRNPKDSERHLIVTLLAFDVPKPD